MLKRIEERIIVVENTIENNPFECLDENNYTLSVYLGDYSIRSYRQIIVDLNKHRSNDSITDNEYILCLKKIYNSKLKVSRRACISIKSGSVKINDSLKPRFEQNDARSTILQFFEGVIEDTKKNLYMLNKYPTFFTLSNPEIIGSDFESRYDSDIYLYKSIVIDRVAPHTFGLLSPEDTKVNEKRALLNIIAYYFGKPLYISTDNPYFNNKLDVLYENFDLTDMLTLRHKEYVNKELHSTSYLCRPVFKNRKYFPLIEIEELSHPQMLDSYHDSLKQFEPLPRCVFLYRVFEYAAAVHYQPKIRPPKYNPRDAIEYYYNKAMNHQFSTLYMVRPYRARKVNPGDYKIKNEHSNFLIALKKESKKIIKEWSNHKYLKNKSLGAIIYETGRNRVAHGGKSNFAITYDYEGNYSHINNVNIILELIARYTIEIMNPSIYKLTDTRKNLYKGFIG
ncbi:MAG: hypothetical protein N4A40_12945 [Tissierellales bacterium]|nr:hypothetical protein [Tissierellales bacterium]